VADYFKITYEFQLDNGAQKKFDVLLDEENLALLRGQSDRPPEWARLEFHQCTNCPLNTTLTPYCPIAANLSEIARAFKDVTGTDKATITVTVKERAYFKAGSIQEGLSPLLGIIMTTSGCPIMEPLKPMVRYHLPFASLEETIFRMVSMYLMAQYLRSQSGKKPEWTLDEIFRIYGEVKKLNKDFGLRMRAAAESDANIHALVKLNVFAVMVPVEAEKILKKITPLFSSYLK
jgi:metal-sulfur cluster biosynthetic enzyme